MQALSFSTLFKFVSYYILKAFTPCEILPLVQAPLELKFAVETGAGWGGKDEKTNVSGILQSCQPPLLPPHPPEQQAGTSWRGEKPPWGGVNIHASSGGLSGLVTGSMEGLAQLSGLVAWKPSEARLSASPC